MILETTLLATLFALPVADGAREEAKIDAPVSRIAVMGASATDGFLLSNEVGAMVTLADVIRGAVATEIPLPLRRSSAMFFTDPLRFGRIYAEQLQAYDPTAVIAVDYLFWFAYGFQRSEEARMERLNQGLRFLEDFRCEVVVADLPDFSEAARSGVGIHGRPMIAPSQVPQPATLAKLNARIYEWAAARKNAHVAPLAYFRQRVDEHVGFEFRGNSWGADAESVLMDKDMLHTRFEGTVALGILALDVLVRESETFKEDAFLWDVHQIKQRVLKARAKERAQRGFPTASRADSGGSRR